MNKIESYYDANAQDEWERFERHRMEFAITKRVLGQRLPPSPARILDCGGGPGRYAIHLAKQGYAVTLLDLAQANLALALNKAKNAGAEITAYVHGNALDLSRFAEGQFDAVLLLVPLYHLVAPDDRCHALAESLRVLRPGGRLFAGFITVYAPFRDAVAKGYLLDYFTNQAETQRLLETQCANPGFTDCWFARPAEILPLMESFGLRTLDLLAAEGLAAGHEQYLNQLEGTAFDYWVDLNEHFCRDPYLFGAADHLLYVGEKKPEL
ncbi:MAG TPA: class I SAM-dependent methyltransferase [Anaerolinea sp.]|nr:class I SAM-dependent methyltransferase [Anaerolinea sp.]